MSKFWQKTHRRLHPEKKIVPEPLQPAGSLLRQSAKNSLRPLRSVRSNRLQICLPGD